MFIRHRVVKLDTLAGLAVKYNVTVSDIKRANGFQTDTAMFGKDTILIPTKPMPIGPDYAPWAGIIVAHYGKMPSNSNGSLRPTSAAALSELRGYYSTGPSFSNTPIGSDDEEYDEHGAWNPFNKQSQGEVELMSRQAPLKNTPAYIEERLRRRRNNDDGDEMMPQQTAPGAFQSFLGTLSNSIHSGVASIHSSSSSGNTTHAASNRNNNTRGGSPWRKPLFRSATTGHHERTNSLGSGLQDLNLKEWHKKSLQWKDQFINKIKKVASQPALVPAIGDMNGSSHAVVESTSSGVGIGQSTAVVHSRNKECRKAD